MIDLKHYRFQTQHIICTYAYIIKQFLDLTHIWILHSLKLCYLKRGYFVREYKSFCQLYSGKSFSLVLTKWSAVWQVALFLNKKAFSLCPERLNTGGRSPFVWDVAAHQFFKTPSGALHVAIFHQKLEISFHKLPSCNFTAIHYWI